MSIKKYVFGKAKKSSGLFLDQQPYVPFYAYSLRKLSSNYNGNCIRVRRDLDNAELDIGFLENSIDSTSLLSFVGKGNGFVTMWYDQSLNNKNQIQTLNSAQPKIVSSGNVILENGLPTIYFTVENSLDLSDTRNIDEMSAFYVVSLKEGTQSYYGIARHILPNGRGFALYAGYGTGSPNIIPYLNGEAADLAFGTPAENLPTILTARAFSIMGANDFSNSIYMKNNYKDNLARGESSWGYYNTSGINLGYQNSKAIMNLSEYIVFSNANRDSLVTLSKNSVEYYNITE